MFETNPTLYNITNVCTQIAHEKGNNKILDKQDGAA